jgi:hypothetical protein
MQLKRQAHHKVQIERRNKIHIIYVELNNIFFKLTIHDNDIRAELCTKSMSCQHFSD